MSRARLHLACIALVMAASGCSSGAGQVLMTSERSFEPTTINVRAGDEVLFLNESGDSHTVTAHNGALPVGATYFASGGFSSEDAARREMAKGLIDPGAEFAIKLDIPGAYPYFCIPHEDQGMSGLIVVE